MMNLQGKNGRNAFKIILIIIVVALVAAMVIPMVLSYIG